MISRKLNVHTRQIQRRKKIGFGVYYLKLLSFFRNALN